MIAHSGVTTSKKNEIKFDELNFYQKYFLYNEDVTEKKYFA